MSAHVSKVNRPLRTSHRTRPERVSQRVSSRTTSRLVADVGLLEDASRVTPQQIRALQRTVGNGATSHFIQTKLRVGSRDDRHEREANRVAQQVLVMPPVPARPRIQRQEEDEATLDLYGVGNVKKPTLTLYEARSSEPLLVEADPSQLHGEAWIDVVHLRAGGPFPHTVKRDAFNAFVKATGMKVRSVAEWFGDTEGVEEETEKTEERKGEPVTAKSSGGTGAQLWSVERFRAATRAGRLARRDEMLKQLDKKLALFHYQKAASEKSASDAQLYENLRILGAIFGELQTLARLWLEKTSTKDGNQRKRVAGVRAFQTLVSQPQTLQKTEEVILEQVVKRHFPSEDVETDLLETALGTYGSYADWLGGSGRDEWLGATQTENVAGGSYGLLANLLGLGVGSGKIHQARKGKKVAKRELELLKYKVKGEDELFGATALLHKQISQVNKGLASDSATVGSSLNGITNAISTIIQGAASGATATMAALLANVTFAIGYGVGTILNLIQAGRDFFNVHKRRKGQKAVARIIQAYDHRLGTLRDEIGEANKQIKNVGDETDLTSKERLTRLKEATKTVKEHKEEIVTLEARRSAFAVSKRKQGAKGKGLSGVLNLVGAAGGTALTIAGIAAAAGVGASLAAAGPVGWALAGTALLGILAFAIGKKIKQSIRAKNVKRMRRELAFVNEYINKGTINGVPSPAYNKKGAVIAAARRNVTMRSTARQGHAWHRFMVEPEGVKVEKKGWFNRLISSKKSGTLTMGERAAHLNAYLGKYDKQKAGENAIAGIIEALAPGTAGNVEVKVDDPQNPGAKKALTLRDAMQGLLQSYFPKDWRKMQVSLLSKDDSNSHYDFRH